MRNVLGISAVLLMCIVLSSCSGNRPEKAFMGAWENKEDRVELTFREKGIWFYTYTYNDKTISGTWTVDPDGNALMDGREEDAEDGIARIMNDGRILWTDSHGGERMWFEKASTRVK
jgi:hypothetical protein